MYGSLKQFAQKNNNKPAQIADLSLSEFTYKVN